MFTVISANNCLFKWSYNNVFKLTLGVTGLPKFSLNFLNLFLAIYSQSENYLLRYFMELRLHAKDL